jgi:serine/threonine protein kinase/tetratricopeptide (TPR) repeat protein
MALLGTLTMRDLIGRTLGHYRIVDKIGEGGMGVVYRAHDERLDRDVAVKVLPASVAQDADRLARFEREAKTVAKLAHPNILEVWDFGREGGVTYAVTELLDGQNLRHSIPPSGMPWQKVVEIGAAIADGLAAAQSKGIVHRDLKPENVFVTSDGRVKILDFGLAQVKVPVDEEAETAALTPAGTAAGTVMGTMGYMSPEQLRGEPSDARSDIFALGCVLYEMLSGQTAFLRNSTAETSAAILKEEPPSLSGSGETFPDEMERTIRRCLEKSPDARFQSASDLAYNLRTISTSPALAATSGVPRTGDRRKMIAWAAIVFVIVFAVAFSLILSGPLQKETAAPQPEVTLPRIVVLPFENLGSPEDEYFADGITGEIIHRLAAISGLEVISRTSAMYYKGKQIPLQQIGEELDVGYVLEGTIRWDRSGGGHGRVRITPELIRVDGDSHLWSERYDRVLEDIFAVQSDIAERTAKSLQVNLLDSERHIVEYQPTDNMDAYRAALWNGSTTMGVDDDDQVRASIQILEAAVAADPEFAVGYAALSYSHSRYYHLRYDFTPARVAMAKAAVERAFELQPALPEAHRALGFFYYWCHWDYGSAIEQLEIAATSLPNDLHVRMGFFVVYRRQGRWDEALEALERWQRIDPQRYGMLLEVAITYRFLRRYEEAEEQAKRAVAIGPELQDSYIVGAEGYVLSDGNTTRARRLLESAPAIEEPRFQLAKLQLDLLDRKPETALANVHHSEFDVFANEIIYRPRELLECLCLSQLGEEEAAALACQAAREKLKREAEARPHDFRLFLALGEAYALMGRREDAVRDAEHASELMPISKDALVGTNVAIELAKTYVWVGEVEKALELIDELLSIPCDLSVGLLRLDPVWDPLRDHPRFHALLEKYDTN